MDRTPQAKRWDRLSPAARRKAEINSERATFGPDSGAMAEALKQALLDMVPDASPTANPARIRRQRYRDERTR
jgi:hypothetical protein